MVQFRKQVCLSTLKAGRFKDGPLYFKLYSEFINVKYCAQQHIAAL